MNVHDATEAAYKRGYEDGKRDAVEAEKMEVLFIGIEQPDRSKDLYTFAFDFELGGITYKYWENLTAELFENFGFEKVKHGRWERADDDYFNLSLIKCSVCREEWCFEDDGDVVALNYHYCPNCGAKMDGDTDGKE